MKLGRPRKPDKPRPANIPPAIPPKPTVLNEAESALWDELTPLLLHHGVTLADAEALRDLVQCQCDYDRFRDQLETDGITIKLKNGTMMPNPKLRQQHAAWQRLMVLRRQFGLTPYSRGHLKVPKREAADDPLDVLIDGGSN